MRTAHRLRPLQVASVVIMTLVLMVTNAVSLVATVFDRCVIEWSRGLEMVVYLKTDADHDVIADLEKTARASGEFNEIIFKDATSATRDFLKSLGRGAVGLLDSPDWKSPIPATLELRLSDRVPIDRRASLMSSWSQRFASAHGVADVYYGQGWIENFSRFIGGARSLFVGAWVLGAVVGLLIVGNCIRLSFHQRRDEIEILELLGATPRFIRRPYLTEGLLLGVTASALSLAISWGLHVFILRALGGWGEPWDTIATIPPLPKLGIVINVVSGLGFGLLGAWDCVRRLNTGWSAVQ